MTGAARAWWAPVLAVCVCLAAIWPYRDGLAPDLAAALRPGSGLEALPPEAARAIALLRRNNVTSYALRNVAHIGDDAQIFQRIVEGGYPIRLAGASLVVLARGPDTLSPGCATIDRDGDWLLVRCP